MAKRKELTVRCFIERDGQEPVLLDTLPLEERLEISRALNEKFRAGLQEYINTHPEEYAFLPG